MRISIIAVAALVALAGAAGYCLGAQHRIIEPDAWGVTMNIEVAGKNKVAFADRYDCEVLVEGKSPGCEPLSFAQAHARGFELIPLNRGRD
jgi:hypothetical protein